MASPSLICRVHAGDRDQRKPAGLYRNESFELPQEGEVPVTFIFELPLLPTTIP
jgi:hypothetical protein